MVDTIVCWLWADELVAPSRTYLPEHVNVLARMLARNLSRQVSVVCIADEPAGLSSDVTWMQTPREAKELANLRSPQGTRFPSCYRRLWAFSEEAKVLGDRILCLDIDVVVMGPIDHLFEAEGKFVGWRPRVVWGRHDRMAGGTYMLRTGTRTDVWTKFGKNSIAEAHSHGFKGSDQAWMSYCLQGDNTWPATCGIYSINDLRIPGSVHLGGGEPFYRKPFTDTCLLHFNGLIKPWQSNLRWVKEHWN